MKPFKNLIEFIADDGRHFYNRDIKCPVCGEIMWWDGNDTTSNPYLLSLGLVCPNECCQMEVRYKDFILWDDELEHLNKH